MLVRSVLALSFALFTLSSVSALAMPTKPSSYAQDCEKRPGFRKNSWLVEVPDEKFGDVIGKLRTTPGVEVVAMAHREWTLGGTATDVNRIVFEMNPNYFESPAIAARKKSDLLKDLVASSSDVSLSCAPALQE